MDGLDNSKDYTAKVVRIDGSVVAVHTTTDHPDSSYGLKVWVDDDGNGYGQIQFTFMSPFYRFVEIDEIAGTSEIYVVEPCMIGDSATIEDAVFIAEYLTQHGCSARAEDTSGHANDPEIAPSDALWNEACAACAEANNWEG